MGGKSPTVQGILMDKHKPPPFRRYFFRLMEKKSPTVLAVFFRLMENPPRLDIFLPPDGKSPPFYGFSPPDGKSIKKPSTRNIVEGKESGGSSELQCGASLGGEPTVQAVFLPPDGKSPSFGHFSSA